MSKVKKLTIASESEAAQLFEAMGVKTYDEAIERLQQAKQRDEQPIVVQEKIVGAALDAMLALYKAIEREYGVTLVQGAMGGGGLFSPPKRQEVQEVVIETGPGQKVTIPIGEFKLPGELGTIHAGPGIEDGQEFLGVAVKTKRKHREKILKVIELARRVLAEESIYRGKAVRLVFRQTMFQGEFATLSFMDLSGVAPSDLVFARELEAAINVDLFARVRYPEQLRSMSVPTKHVVLLAGPYGCGKTMLAHVAAKLATKHGRTFIYLEDVLQLPRALRFGDQYGRVMIFSEDFDRVADADDEELETAVRNTLDGIDTKDLDVVLVLTTNHPEKIPAALRRPGRIDAALEIGPPDAEAAERMLRNYARGLIPLSEDLGLAAGRLSGQIPATIRAVIERAKVVALSRLDGMVPTTLVAADVETAAYSVLKQRELLTERETVELTEHERACQLLGEAFGKALGSGVKDATTTLTNGHALTVNGKGHVAQVTQVGA